MKKSVKITIEKQNPKTNISQYATQFDALSGTTVLELKTDIKATITNTFEIVKETLWDGQKELKDVDLLPKSSYLDYIMTVK
jgi:hypothetical protein